MDRDSAGSAATAQTRAASRSSRLPRRPPPAMCVDWYPCGPPSPMNFTVVAPFAERILCARESLSLRAGAVKFRGAPAEIYMRTRFHKTGLVCQDRRKSGEGDHEN